MFQVFGELSQFHLIADEESLEAVLTAWYILPSTRRMGASGWYGDQRTQENYMTPAENLLTRQNLMDEYWTWPIVWILVHLAPRFLCRHVAQLACKENQLVAVKFEWQNAEKTAAGSRVRCWKWAVWGLRVSLKWGFLLSFSFPAPVVGSAAQHLEGFLFAERVVSLSSQSRQVEQEYPLAVNMHMELSPIHQEKHPCRPFCGGFPIAIFDYWRVHQELSWLAPFSWAFPKRRGWRGRQPWRNFLPLDHPRVPDSVVLPQWHGYKSPD